MNVRKEKNHKRGKDNVRRGKKDRKAVVIDFLKAARQLLKNRRRKNQV